MSLWLKLHRMFGPIRRFQYLENEEFICFLHASGFTKEDLQFSFTPNHLLQVAGEKTLYEKHQVVKKLEMDELVHLPEKVNKDSIEWNVEHGFVIIRCSTN